MKPTLFKAAIFLLCLSILTLAIRVQPAQSREPAEITFWALRPGTEVYDNSFALSTLVNRHSKWLRIVIKVSQGSLPTMRKLQAEPKWRSKVAFGSAYAVMGMARRGTRPFKGQYRSPRAIALFSASADALATYDSRIKTKGDLAGKRAMLMPTFFTNTMTTKTIIEKVWGLKGQVKISHGFDDNIFNALRDGTVDVGLVNVRAQTPNGPFEPSAGLAEINLTKPGLHFLSNGTREERKAATAANGVPSFSTVVPAAKFGPTQTGPLSAGVTMLYWAADSVMDDDIVYEMIRILYDYMDEYNKILPAAGMKRENMAKIPWPEELFHAGAVRLYKEKGIPIGIK